MSFLFAGIIAAFIAAFTELFVSSSSDIIFTARQTIVENAPMTTAGILLFAVIEETTKLIFLRKTVSVAREKLLFPIRTALFALGFAGTELFFVQEKFAEAPTAALAGILAVHFATIFLYGYGIEKSLSRPQLGILLVIGIALHFLYNLALI